jgi:exosortase/archaeosortase family protein
LPAALNLFDVSVIVWIAFAAGLALVRKASREPARRSDFALAAIVIGAAVLPIGSASAAALALLAAYAIATTPANTPLRRGAIVFLAMTGALIWGPLLLELFSRPMLGFDAFLVALFGGTVRVGNQIAFADGSGGFIVAPGCSSFHGMSLAIIFWATVNQWFEVPCSRSSVLTLAAALLGTLAINGGRLAALAHFPAHFDALHLGLGAQVVSWFALALVVAICLYGARREVFAKG